MIREPNSRAQVGGQARSPELRARLIAQLVELQPQLRRRFESAMPKHLTALGESLSDVLADTTMRQFEVLGLLAKRGPLAMHDLATLHGISRSSTTELVDRLVARELVERYHDPKDRRGVVVALSAGAESLLSQMKKLHQERLGTLIDVYDDEELLTLVHLLKKLAASDAASPGQPSPAPCTTADGSADQLPVTPR